MWFFYTVIGIIVIATVIDIWVNWNAKEEAKPVNDGSKCACDTHGPYCRYCHDVLMDTTPI